VTEDAADTVRTPRDETALERADRNYGEPLQELRNLQSGVEILFACLLVSALTLRMQQHGEVHRAPCGSSSGEGRAF
jgi:hypothetical protein